MILGGRFAYTQNPPPKSLSNYSIKGDAMCLWRAFWSVVCLCVCVSVCVCVCGFQPSSSLCEQREAPEQGERSSGSDGGDRQWQNVQRGGSEGGRVRQRVTGPDKYPHTQTTTTRDKRTEQWQQESWTQVGRLDQQSQGRLGTTRRSATSPEWFEWKVYKVKRALLARQK